MQKHRKNNNGRRRWHDANASLSESATTALVELLNGFDESDDSFAVNYLRSEYLSKYLDESVVPAEARRSAAIAKWMHQDQVLNRETNQSLTSVDPDFNILPRVTWKKFVKFARQVISQILGPLDDSIVVGDFSGGATTSRSRRVSQRANKFTPKADATEGCFPYVDVLHRESELIREYGLFTSLNEVRGAKLFTVPKKSDIDRCACKEPDFNMYLQKGAGNLIRRNLRRAGINLNDQSKNRDLAKLGSLTGELATLDLSSASDSISIEAVRLLLPSDWFEYLNSIRSQEVEVDGTFVRTEMFSSMGNGFTFELESLIFYSLVRSVSYFEGSQGIVSVYGDDIICPVGIYDLTVFVLGRFGFVVNQKKSFSSGGFRESCGGHYYYGHDVTPFYLKRKPERLTDAIRIINQFRRWIFADPSRQYELPATYNMWLSLANLVRKDLWGGDDYAVDTQLVAPVPPTRKLIRLAKDRKDDPTGSYLAWHHSNRKREMNPSQDSFDPVNTSNSCRLRAVSRHGTLPHYDYFRQELV